MPEYSNGSIVFINSKAYKLTENVGSGGEGTVYKSSGLKGQVIKIYRKDIPREKIDKIKTYVKLDIDNEHICGPRYPVFSSMDAKADNLIGFTMFESHGEVLDKKISELYGKGSKYSRKDLVTLIVRILELYDVLYSVHDTTILIGDINLQNIMVDERLQPYLIDVDSVQIGNRRCAVGRPEFLSARLQTESADTQNGSSGLLRNTKDESFAIATLIFMLLFSRKAPFAKIGGGSPTDNIIACKFQYNRDGSVKRDVPPGKYKHIWSYIPSYLREAFCRVFGSLNQEKWPDYREWLGLMQRYQSEFNAIINRDPVANELLPETSAQDKIEVKCSCCGKSFMTLAKSRSKYCPECMREVKVTCNICGKAYKTRFYEIKTGHTQICTSCRKEASQIPSTIDSQLAEYSKPVKYTGPEVFVTRFKKFESYCSGTFQKQISILSMLDASETKTQKTKLEKFEVFMKHEQEVFQPIMGRLETLRFSFENNTAIEELEKNIMTGTCKIGGMLIPYSYLPFFPTLEMALDGEKQVLGEFREFKHSYDILTALTPKSECPGNAEAEYLKSQANEVRKHYTIQSEEMEKLEQGLKTLEILQIKKLEKRFKSTRMTEGMLLMCFALTALFGFQLYQLSMLSTSRLIIAAALLVLSLFVGFPNESEGVGANFLLCGISILVLGWGVSADLSYVLSHMPIGFVLAVGFASFLIGYLMIPLEKNIKKEA